MKQVQLSAYGAPEEVARCVEVPDVGAPADDEVVFDVLLFPINPADVWFCRGSYRLKPPLPATPGAECVGRVAAVGAAVSHVKPGDLVINLQRENWAQRRRVKGDDVIRLPDGIDLQQAAMVRINPPTASLMLSDFVDLLPGDWVIQNVANSAVGKLLIRLARGRGLRTLNVVRREALFDELTALGADACVVDGPDLWQRARALTGNAPIKLGIDAVSGEATGRLGNCVADGGAVCNYGSMTGQDPVMNRADVIYRGVILTGFMLGRFLARKPVEQVRALYDELAGRVVSGDLSAPVERVYPIEEIKEALARAQQGERSGKILVAPNGPV
ncbi:MAG: zinc-dependent alcohol dehydrogenase family protein [Alphaproteobacteria bacterium]|nr:zinc-dependent alcohol dehydrogenase family protein [Alphaproteobacteria bacterium]MCW5742781.1 zinc-dependent alcohol dehydrogenase family protein [Alphaproteobacteria bacterium]